MRPSCGSSRVTAVRRSSAGAQAPAGTLVLPPDDPRHALIDLYLPICSATVARPITVGHLGQSLDGFIATHAGESQYVTGEENIRHLHRMRALCDAVVVGAGTVAADDPQLTTRHVSGPSPVRVVLDPTRRLADHYRVFNDDTADTLYVCGRSLRRRGRNAFRPRDDGGGRGQRRRHRRHRGAAAAARARLPPDFRRRRRRHRVDVSRGEPARSPADRDRAADHRRRPAGDPPAAAHRRSATAIVRAIASSGWAPTCCSTATSARTPTARATSSHRLLALSDADVAGS